MTSKKAPNAKENNPGSAPAKLGAKAPADNQPTPFAPKAGANAYRAYLKFQNPGATGSSDLMRWLTTGTESIGKATAGSR